jgi:hypothetical protein
MNVRTCICGFPEGQKHLFAHFRFNVYDRGLTAIQLSPQRWSVRSAEREQARRRTMSSAAAWFANKAAKFVSNNQTKGVPLNQNLISSDSYDDDSSDLKSPPESSSSPRFEPESSSTPLLKRSDKSVAKAEKRRRTAGRYVQAAASFAASTVVSHFAPGAGGLFNLPGAGKKAASIARLQELRGQKCEGGDNNGICQTLITCVLERRNAGLGNSIWKMIPGAGILVGAQDKLHNADKRLAGTHEEGREELARLLIEHAKECDIAKAIYTEVLCSGGSFSKEALVTAMIDIENDEQWGRSDEPPSHRARDKAMENLKPV